MTIVPGLSTADPWDAGMSKPASKSDIIKFSGILTVYEMPSLMSKAVGVIVNNATIEFLSEKEIGFYKVRVTDDDDLSIIGYMLSHIFISGV